MNDPVAGFYAVYFTSREGNFGVAMVAAARGAIVGADPMGAQIDGSYQRTADGHLALVTVTLAPGVEPVQGGGAEHTGKTYEIRFSFKRSPNEEPFIRIESPLGPLNVRFVKLRSLDV